MEFMKKYYSAQKWKHLTQRRSSSLKIISLLHDSEDSVWENAGNARESARRQTTISQQCKESETEIKCEIPIQINGLDKDPKRSNKLMGLQAKVET